MDKFRTYVAAAMRLDAVKRRNVVTDTQAAIVGVFGGKDAIESYLGRLTDCAK